MTPQQAREFKARWQKVDERQLHELRAMTPAQKLEQWARLREWVKVFGWERALAEEEQEVRDRWNKLRRLYRERS